MPPRKTLCGGYPPPSDAGWGTPPQVKAGWGPPPHVDRQTRVKLLPSLVLRTRAVTDVNCGWLFIS